MSTFFTSDTHFGHANIIKYAKRPFSNLKEMDKTIISNWNRIIGSSDTVYHLGDFVFGYDLDIKRYRDQLNGNIILIEGNHDKTYRWNLATRKLFDRITKIDSFKLEDIHIVMCHYAMRVWDRSHFNTWHLYGHTHGTLFPEGKSWDVGVDFNNFTPLSVDQLVDIMKKRPDNFNLIK